MAVRPGGREVGKTRFHDLVYADDITFFMESTTDAITSLSSFKYARLTFCSCDLDLDPMTLIYELDIDILKMYLPKMKFLGHVRARTGQTHKQTDRQMESNALPRHIHGL